MDSLIDDEYLPKEKSHDGERLAEGRLNGIIRVKATLATDLVVLSLVKGVDGYPPTKARSEVKTTDWQDFSK
jgi:hypothetical protein